MNFPLQSLIQMGVVPAVNFPPDSRYYRSSTLTYTTPDGQSISYLASCSHQGGVAWAV